MATDVNIEKPGEMNNASLKKALCKSVKGWDTARLDAGDAYLEAAFDQFKADWKHNKSKAHTLQGLDQAPGGVLNSQTGTLIKY